LGIFKGAGVAALPGNSQAQVINLSAPIFGMNEEYPIRLENLTGNHLPEAVTHAMSLDWDYLREGVLSKRTTQEEANVLYVQLRDKFQVKVGMVDVDLGERLAYRR
jgi:hypothetical protein